MAEIKQVELTVAVHEEDGMYWAEVPRSLSSRLRHLVVEFSVRPPLWAVC
jgi:hypothetical protein